MRMPLLGMKSRLRASAAVATGVLAISGLASYGVSAGANPQPSITEVQAKVNQYQSQFDQDNQQYDQAVQQASQARVKLAAVNKQVAANEVRFKSLRGAVAQIAAASYESGDTTSIAGLLTSNNPNTVLNGASLLLEISGTRNQKLNQFLVAARQLKDSQQQAQRTRDALTAIEQTAKQKQQHAIQQLSNEKTIQANLTAQQQTQVAATSIGAGGTTAAVYTGTTSTQGGKAAAFAVSRLGCPYYWGGNGPCNAPGYDCSGLVQEAWASAGVSIPRTTYEQWASLPHVSMSSLIPGDLILLNGESHVAMYVGNGKIVDAPHSGAVVEEVSLAGSWYATSADGAVRP